MNLLEDISQNAKRLLGVPPTAASADKLGDHNPDLFERKRDSQKIFQEHEEPGTPFMKFFERCCIEIASGILIFTLVFVVSGYALPANTFSALEDLRDYFSTPAEKLDLRDIPRIQATSDSEVTKGISPGMLQSPYRSLHVSYTYQPDISGFKVTEQYEMLTTESIMRYGFVRRLPIAGRGEGGLVVASYDSVKVDLSLPGQNGDPIEAELVQEEFKGHQAIQANVREVFGSLIADERTSISFNLTLSYTISNVTYELGKENVTVFEWPLYHRSNYEVPSFSMDFSFPTIRDREQVKLFGAKVLTDWDQEHSEPQLQSFREQTVKNTDSVGFNLSKNKLALGSKMLPIVKVVIK